ncbi:MAG TPA: hypothetical protein VJR23_15215 [Candidatus Acidoferrales bacterium]|nr:hypothetical protein [Candidatus Acidoferrales bacterium]
MSVMPPFTARAVVLALVGGSFAVLANMISLIMIGKINERVPVSERLSYVFWGTEVKKKFKQLYPDSRLALLFNLCIVLMVISFALLLRFWVFT